MPSANACLISAVRHAVEPGEDRAEAVVRVQAGGGEVGAEALEDAREERADDVAEDDRVGDLHHRGLEVHREQHALLLCGGDLVAEERLERTDVQHGAVDDLAREDGDRLLEHGGLAVGRHELDRQGVVGRRDPRLLVRAEVVLAHRHDVRPRVVAPGTHAVRVLLRVVLHGERCAAVRVALAEHRVHGAALGAVVAGADVALLVRGGLVGVGGQVVALRLELLDRGLELRDRRRDVRQLDDVRLGLLRELAEFGQGVVQALLVTEPLRELRDDPAGERDVAGLDVDPRGACERLDDRQERVGGEERCLVREGVDDLGHAGGYSLVRPSVRPRYSRRGMSRHQDTWALRRQPGCRRRVRRW